MNHHKDRIYLDYNATSPLSSSVKEWASEEFEVFANPSSIHTQGKATKRCIRGVSSTLYKVFGLDNQDFDLVYHSGASEGANSFFKGKALDLLNQGIKPTFVYSPTDHSCIRKQKDFFDIFNCQSVALPLSSSGKVDIASSLNLFKTIDEPILLNWTWVNNETGLVQNLKELEFLKSLDAKKVWVHIDAVQSVGKVKNWNRLGDFFDAITFSGHKFGTLKGIGFSFYKKDLKLFPLIDGGEQQAGRRSGTENIHGILSIAKAIQDVLEFNLEQTYEIKQKFEYELEKVLGSEGEIILRDQERSSNTTFFILKKFDSQAVSMSLDLEGFDISNGSACSSGAVTPSHVLLSLGYNEKQAKSAIRVSFPPNISRDFYLSFKDRFFNVIKRFC